MSSAIKKPADRAAEVIDESVDVTRIRPRALPPVPAHGAKRLTVSFADELPSHFQAPDELIEGLLVAGGVSVLYGDSNSGKTFAAVSMACAVAQGIPWLGRQTERSAVVYLACESPASVIARLQAYQENFGVRVPDFAVVHNPINLYAADADTTAVIRLVKEIEAERGVKVGLVVCDTLARASAGANENSGEDMGPVIGRLDRIKSECDAHVMVIHHSGKNQAQGSRGWSGIRAAMDSEFEVTDSAQGRCLEITKQRDLNTKGERIGFRLTQVVLGLTKWGTPATSCVVESMDAPPRPTAKRQSDIAGAIAEFLRAKGAGVRKKEIVEHFEGLYTSSAVYRELKKMAESGVACEIAGLVAIQKGVPNGAD